RRRSPHRRWFTSDDASPERRHVIERRIVTVRAPTRWRSVVELRAQREHRTRRVTYDLLGDAPDEHARQPTAAVRREHDQVDVLALRVLQDSLHRRLADDERRLDLRDVGKALA